MPTIRRRRVMRRKDARDLMEEAGILLGDSQPNTVEQAEVDGTTVYLMDGAPVLARDGDTLYPTLRNPHLDRLPSVVVDMGAVPYVCSGADVMAPGIVEVRGEFEEGDLVVVRDVRHGKALAVGRALTSSGGLRAMGRGRGVKNLHHVGDGLWRAMAD